MDKIPDDNSTSTNNTSAVDERPLQPPGARKAHRPLVCVVKHFKHKLCGASTSLLRKIALESKFNKHQLDVTPTIQNSRRSHLSHSHQPNSIPDTSVDVEIPSSSQVTYSNGQPKETRTILPSSTLLPNDMTSIRNATEPLDPSVTPKILDRPQPSALTHAPSQQPISQTITVEQASNEGLAEPVELDIQALRYKPSETPSSWQQPGTMGNLPPEWKTMFKMVIHLPNKDQTKTRIAKLDTGSSVDVVSESVADALGMRMESYHGANVAPLGEPITPLGQLTLDWHVMGKGATYTTTFLVLPSDFSTGFDVLLSDDTIGKVGFYKVNDTIWYLRKA